MGFFRDGGRPTVETIRLHLGLDLPGVESAEDGVSKCCLLLTFEYGLYGRLTDLGARIALCCSSGRGNYPQIREEFDKKGEGKEVLSLFYVVILHCSLIACAAFSTRLAGFGPQLCIAEIWVLAGAVSTQNRGLWLAVIGIL